MSRDELGTTGTWCALVAIAALVGVAAVFGMAAGVLSCVVAAAAFMAGAAGALLGRDDQ